MATNRPGLDHGVSPCGYSCRLAKTVSPYRCVECGWTTLKWVGRCGEYRSWGTVIEAGENPKRPRVEPAAISDHDAARPITKVTTAEAAHQSVGIGAFDRVLGGGIVPGAAVLLSGEPGVGKSTLLLDVAHKVASRGKSVLYVSAEESLSQVRLRAERTGAMVDTLLLASTTDLASVLGQVEKLEPSPLIVDSIHTIQAGTLDSLAGGPAQVPEVANSLIRLAKAKNLAVIIVGHVTKDGQVAGPRTLEHLVDVVCQFEGDRQSALRFVRVLKNRFGPTDEVGCFEMTGDGTVEFSDPSALFGSGSGSSVIGTCTTIALEGRSALPVEIQALVVPTNAPQPRRVVNGVDSSRVAMVLAGLERRAGLKLSSADVYVSTVGGIKLSEPAADLAMSLAIASAYKDQPVDSHVAAVGEISLAGEIRQVTSNSQRKSEAERLGIGEFIDTEVGNIRQALIRGRGNPKSEAAPY